MSSYVSEADVVGFMEGTVITASQRHVLAKAQEWAICDVEV